MKGIKNNKLNLKDHLHPLQPTSRIKRRISNVQKAFSLQISFWEESLPLWIQMHHKKRSRSQERRKKHLANKEGSVCL